MRTSGTELTEALAQSVSVSDDALVVNLAGGKTITVPLAWFPLWHTGQQRSAVTGAALAAQEHLKGGILPPRSHAGRSVPLQAQALRPCAVPPYIFISRILPFDVDSSMAGPPAPILPSR